MENIYSDMFTIVTRTEEEYRAALKARELFPRDDDDYCLVCDASKKLACDDSCNESEGFECRQVVQVDNCHECPSVKCVKGDGFDDFQKNGVQGNNSDSGPNVGIIVGAVIGGVVGIAAITFLVWWFCIRNKREAAEDVMYDEVSEQKADTVTSIQDRRDQRSSMHTVHSIASTVLTRASNIIQIAYIPGVTNRAAPTSPNVLVPPVPPIPITVTDANSPSPYEDQHFFMPGDLRDSTYSAMSGYTDRTSMARTSYAPRSSVASTLYGKNAIIATPSTARVIRPGMVVTPRSGAPSVASASSAPPMPTIDYDKYNPRNSQESYFSIGDALTKKSTAPAQTARVVRAGSGKTVTVRNAKEAKGDDSSSTAPSVRSPLARESSAPTTIPEDEAQEGPFSDPQPPRRRDSLKSNKSLSAVIEEATRRAAQVDKNKRISRETSPFGDEHATKD